MKKLFCVVLTAIAVSGGLFAQNFDRSTNLFVSEPVYECLYNYETINTLKGDTIKEVTSCALQIGDGVGRFSDYTAFSTDSARYVADSTEELVASMIDRERKNRFFYDEIVYQNKPVGKMSVYGVITPNYFVYEEDGNLIDWEITDETDTVCGYECMKAVGEYGGRKWIVWFAAEIPVSMGPWKLGGLPGLIMAASDTEGVHNFKAISFRKGDVPLYLPMRPDAIKTERNKFVRQKNDFESSPDPMKNIPVESIQSVRVRKTGTGPKDALIEFNGVPLRVRENGYIARELK